MPPRLASPRRALPSLVLLLAVALGGLTLSGCQTLREVANLRKVNFRLNAVRQPSLVGIDLDRVRSYDDLRAGDVLRITRAIREREMPLRFDLIVGAENPQGNSVNARLVRFDWTLFLDDKQTISGVFNDEIVMPPGQPREIPLAIELDLIDFFDRSAQDLVELALAVVGQNGQPKRIKVEAQPTINTAVGAIRYPRPVVIANEEVGS